MWGLTSGDSGSQIIDVSTHQELIDMRLPCFILCVYCIYVWSVSFIPNHSKVFYLAMCCFYLVLFVCTHAILLFPQILICPFRKVEWGDISHWMFSLEAGPAKGSAKCPILLFRRSLNLITQWRTETLEGLMVCSHGFDQVSTLIKV